ncbi:MAG: DUF1232 domain-containing protein [Candidatus Binatia bacterium]|nr:DUF1232 domain-containing protein [Candidatus Binatia bacterium]
MVRTLGRRVAALDPRRLWQLWNNVRLGWRLLRDGRVGWLPKAVFVGAIVYVFLPLDLLPDTLPLVGQVDDLLLLLFAWKLFLALCPPQVVEEHARQIARELLAQ